MRYALILLGAGCLVAVGPAEAACSSDIRARMIKNDISQEKIDAVCGEATGERESTGGTGIGNSPASGPDSIEVNINNTNVNVGDSGALPVRQLQEQGVILPLSRIREKAHDHFEGSRMVEADLQVRDGMLVYVVDLIDDGVYREAVFDAGNGEALGLARDD